MLPSCGCMDMLCRAIIKRLFPGRDCSWHFEDEVKGKGLHKGAAVHRALLRRVTLTVLGAIQTILDCSDINEGFYVKCGYTRAGLEMSHYYDGTKKVTNPEV